MALTLAGIAVTQSGLQPSEAPWGTLDGSPFMRAQGLSQDSRFGIATLLGMKWKRQDMDAPVTCSVGVKMTPTVKSQKTSCPPAAPTNRQPEASEGRLTCGQQALLGSGFCPQLSGPVITSVFELLMLSTRAGNATPARF